jgi:2'-5' RNA ligase
MRVFIAIYPEDTKLAAKIKDIQDDIMGLAFPLHPMPPVQNHVTVAFLGEVEEAKVDILIARIQQALTSLRAFELSTGDIVFGIGGNKLVLMIEPSETLRQIREHVIAEANKLGIPVAKEAFTPHISLTRASRYIPEEEKQSIRDRVKGIKIVANFPVRSISIIKSELTHSSPKYTTLHDIHLNSI